MISKLILKFLPFGVCILDIFLTRHRYSLYNKEKGRRLKTEHVYRRMCRKELLLNGSPWEGVSGRLVLGLVWEHGFQKSSYLFHLREVAHCTQAGHCGAAQAPGPPLEAWSSWTPERAPPRPALSETAGTAAEVLSVYRCRAERVLRDSLGKSLGSWCLASSAMPRGPFPFAASALCPSLKVQQYAEFLSPHPTWQWSRGISDG